MACRKSTDLLLPKNSLSNVKIIFLQPLVESNNNNNNNNNNINKKNLSDNNMSLNTLLEAAKFLEMQEEIQHRATLDSSTARSTAICPIIATNGGSNHLTNGTNEIQQPQQKFSIQPVTILSSSSATTTTNSNNNNNNNNLLSHQNNVHSHNSPQQQQTVVISNNNISSTFVPNIHGPISFATATPTTLTGSAISVSSQIILPNNGNKKEQDGHISSTTTQGQKRIMNNSFDIMNPLIIDESGPTESKKLKQPPMVFRSGTREVHNKLEKCRRAHLKECFDLLKKQLPSNGDEKKTSNLSILHSALKYIQLLKRRETEYEHQLERLAREKITNQQRLASLKKDCHFDGMDFSKLLPEIPSSTTTSITQQQQQQQQQKKFKRDSGDGLLIPTSPTSSLSPKNSYTLMADSLLIKHNSADNNLLIKNDDFYNAELSDETSSATVGSVDSSTGIIVNDSTIISPVISQTNSVITSTNGEINKISIPSSSVLGKTIPIVTSTNNNNNNNNNQPSTKEISQASAVQTTGISVLPMPYQVNQGLVLQKVAIVPHKGLTDLAPLVPTHFITTPQQLNGINGQINGKVVPLTQYIVKPMVVVSTANPPVRNGS